MHECKRNKKKTFSKTDLSILQKSKSHLESRILTVVDLKIMDSQSFEYCYTGFVDVERLTQFCICCTVHSANLRKPINTEQGKKERQKGTQKHLNGMSTWMWSFRRNACSFLYSPEEGLLSPNLKLTSQRWWASWLWKPTLTSDKYSKECCSKFCDNLLSTYLKVFTGQQL